MYELINIFDFFLPQLLQYPNPKDPLNVEAASLMRSDIEAYNLKVKSCVEKHAKNHLKGEEVSNKMEIEKPEHKESTDCEDLILDGLSHASELSELSETSNIMFEEELF